jgi:sterol desaturase/sphingolipid hydroxylase (fatty acid hydroxylase superfamily)
VSIVEATWDHCVAWTATEVLAPFLAWLGLGHAGTHELATAMLLGVLQIGIVGLVFRPLESLAPAERWRDRRLTRIDRQYTLLMLLGLSPLFGYLALAPLAESAGLPESGYTLKRLVPWFGSHPYALFLVYYVCYDFTYYWMHRAQHAVPWWWALHSMHHSQRQMSCWTNDRGSYLDGVLQSFILAGVAWLIGIEVDEFAALVLLSELVQCFSHANVRAGFGHALERCFVDPKFHRLHHMRADPDRPDLHNCNFGQVLSVWDVLFGTALYGEPARPTGVCDPVVDADNERGLVAQQWGVLKRFWGAFKRPAGWRLGDVAFAADYEPVPSRHVGQPATERAVATYRAALDHADHPAEPS